MRASRKGVFSTDSRSEPLATKEVTGQRRPGMKGYNTGQGDHAALNGHMRRKRKRKDPAMQAYYRTTHTEAICR